MDLLSEPVFDDGEILFDVASPSLKNTFDLDEVSPEDFNVIMEMDYVSTLMDETTNVFVIEAYDGEAWEFVEYNNGEENWKRPMGYIYGITSLEKITDILRGGSNNE